MIRRLRSFACSARRGFHFPAASRGAWKTASLDAQIVAPMGLNEHREALKQAELRVESIKVSL